MKKNFFLVIFFIFYFFNLEAQVAEKVSQTKLLNDVYKAQELIETKKYDEGLELLFTIRKYIESGGDNQGKSSAFYYTRTIDLECEIYEGKGELDKMLIFIPNILDRYMKVFKEKKLRDPLVIQLANALKRFRSHNDYSKILDSYLFLKGELLDKSELMLMYFDNEINYVNKKSSFNQNNYVVTDLNPNKERDSIRKSNLGDYENSYYDEEPLDITESIGEMMGEVNEYQKTILGVFGLEAGYESKDIKISDININQKVIDSLKKEGYLDGETESSFSIDDLKPAFEIAKRFDTILPNKILRESKKSIEKLQDSGKQNSLVYKMEKMSMLMGNLLNDSDDSLINLEELKENINTFSLGTSEADKLENEIAKAEGLYFVHYVRGDYEKALEQTLKMANSDLNDDKLRWFFMTASIYTMKRDFVNAEVWSKKMIEFNTPNKNESDKEEKNNYKKSAYYLYVNALVANKKYEEAITASNQFENLLKKSNSDSNNDNTSYLMMINSSKAIAFSKVKQYKSADLLVAKQIKQGNEIRLDSAFFSFSYSKETNTKKPYSLINTVSQGSDYIFYYLSQRPKNSDSLVAMGYNSALIYKELLLNTEKTLKKNVISNKTNPEFKDLYYKWIKARELAADVNFKDRDSVLDYAMFYKRKLMQSGYGNLTGEMKNAKLNWKRIKNNLSDNEAAIEFVRFSPYNFQQNYKEKFYGALLITKNLKYPKFINLFNEKELDKYLKPFKDSKTNNIDELYNNLGGDLYDLIWKPLEIDISDIKTIYYSPSGLLYSLAFSALSNPSKGDELLADKHELIQVSSTKYIVSKEIIKGFNSALLFGGLTYDFDVSVEQTINKFLEDQDENRGDKWIELNGTKVEVEEINKILTSKNIDVELRTGAEGIEEAFYKEIEAPSPNILHVATHAFYEPYSKKKGIVEEDEIKEGFDKLKKESDDLNRSGLVLAGANHFWKYGNKMNSEMEDGILTANEIASLELRNTKLVTLSACETAIGNSINSEGVFGIQRGLKMAGAKSLLLSLWKVNDVVAKEYMVTFYDFLINKNFSLQEAYKKTQDLIREKYPEPYKWAAFVLIRNG
tara:strand:- start:54 stop:3290 length:3237 start_codon:yes stop_codon:yes gene_type:complete